MEINVSANSNQSFPVLVSLQTAVKQPIDIDLKTDGSEVLLRGLSLSPRKILEKDSAGLSRFELHMRGEVAASGSISRDEDNLHLDITVNDSDIHPAQSSVIGIMAGSAIELRIATSEHTEVTTINIIPGNQCRLYPTNNHSTQLPNRGRHSTYRNWPRSKCQRSTHRNPHPAKRPRRSTFWRSHLPD
jgi:hypothetical protein